MFSIRRFTIRHATSASWRSRPSSLARALRRFADVEGDSGWQAMQLVQASKDPAIRAAFFGIALEEAAHAEWFREAALVTCADIEAGWELRGRKSLCPKGCDLALAMAEMEINERIVYLEFLDYAAATTHPHVRELFERVRADEAGHSDASRGAANRAGDNPSAQLLRRAHARRLQRTLSALSRAVGDVFAQAFLLLIYGVLGGLSWLIGRFFGCRAPVPPAKPPRYAGQ